MFRSTAILVLIASSANALGLHRRRGLRVAQQEPWAMFAMEDFHESQR